MEEELSYATVVFKNDPRSPKEKNEDGTVYSTVKAATLPSKIPTDVEAAAQPRYFYLLVVSLGILCILLVMCIIAIICICGVMAKHEENFSTSQSNLLIKMQQLIMERNILENKTEELLRDRADLNWTLTFILKHDSFPVKEFCPDKKCQPCQKGWIHFQERCYWFDERHAPWKTWEESRRICKTSSADLVIIDSQQEQEFIGSHTKYYYTKNHGYWLGLWKNTERNWVWVDGRNVTLGYWSEEDSNEMGCVSFVPTGNLTATWAPRVCWMYNKFICETDVLVRTPVS